MKTKISIIVLFIIYTANAQVQNYNWNFGRFMGMGWKETENKIVPGIFGSPPELLSDLPKYYTGSQLATLEGCFTISDNNGDLIVYSDGIRLYNKDNNVISTSNLTGNPSSAQSGTIVPYPNSNGNFVVLSLGNNSSDNLAYRVLTRNGSNYTTNNANTPLDGHKGKLGETVTAGKHSNKNDIWVLAVGRGNSNIEGNMTGHPYLNVWKIFDNSPTQNTIQHEIVTSLDLGDQGVIGNSQPNGYVRFTNDTRHFVWMNFGYGGNVAAGGVPFICYGDFNNTTGEITNVRIKRGIQEGTSYGYGVEFTNDNKYLYVTLSASDVTNNQNSALLVFDFQELLNANSQTDIDTIVPIKKFVTPPGNPQHSPNPYFGALQTGPDGRIYIPSLAKKEVFLIDNPKEPENLRIYRYENPLVTNIGSGPYTLNTSYWGLPNFAVPWYNTAIEISQAPSSLCVNKTIPFNLFVVDGHGFDKVVKIIIDYGDGSQTKEYNGADIVPGLKNESHIYKEIGEYKIRVNSYDINNELINTTFKTILINICTIKVNPYLRGEIE